MSSKQSRQHVRNEARPLGAKRPKPASAAGKAAARAKRQQVESGTRPSSSPHDLNVLPEPNLTRALENLAKTETLEDVQKVVDSVIEPGVESTQHMETAAAEPPNETVATEPHNKKEHNVTLTLKGYSRNGKRAIYVGARTSKHFAKADFVDGVAPQTIELPDSFLGPKEKAAPKPKLTKEERAALPKPTLAERAAKARERADRLAALAANQPSA